MIKQHYEKVIIACCFAFVFANMGMASTAFSVHQPYLVAMEGIGDTGGALILSARTFVSLLVMLVVDRYYDFLDVRRGVFLACVFTFIGFVVYSLANSLPVFIAGAVALGAGYGFGGMMAATLLANRWFSEGVGTAVGIASMGSGFASIVLPLIIVRIIEGYSLSAAFLTEAITALVIGVIVVLLLRNRPSDIGLEPHVGKPGRRKPKPRANMRPAPKAEQRLLLAAVAFVGMYCCGGITYLTVLLTSSGFDAVFAASVMSVVGLTLMLAKLVVGELFDHLGSVAASTVMFVLGATGFVMLCFAGSGIAPLMYVAAGLIGVGLSLGTVGVSVWSLDTSDDSNRTRHIRDFQVAYAFGGFVANTLPGIVKDLVGNYVVSYAGMLVLLLAGAFVIIRYYRKFSV